MNCDFVKEKIYEGVYSGIKPLDDELIRHIDDCPGCNAYYEECQSAIKFTSLLHQKKPSLSNPQKLSDDILDSINELETEKKSDSSTIFMTVKRLLAAASVCLMIVFAYEHYVVVEKLIKLEEQMSAVPGVTFNSSQYQEILTYYPKLEIEYIKSALASGVFESGDKDLKSLFMKASLGILSHKAIAKRLQNQLTHLNISDNDMGIINTILEKEQENE